MQLRNQILFAITALLLLSSCAVQVKDETFCAPIPGNLGAVCDNFLTENQQILSEPEWVSLQNTWLISGQATECTTSQTLGDIKSEIEKLCSKTACDYPTEKKITDGLKRLQALTKVMK